MTIDNGIPPQKRKDLLLWLIIAQILMVASLVVWLFIAGISVMAFDSGPSTAAYIFVGGIWLYPLFPIACSIACWIFYAKKKVVPAVVSSILPFVVPVVFFVLFFSISPSFQG